MFCTPSLTLLRSPCVCYFLFVALFIHRFPNLVVGTITRESVLKVRCLCVCVFVKVSVRKLLYVTSSSKLCCVLLEVCVYRLCSIICDFIYDLSEKIVNFWTAHGMWVGV